MKGAKSAGAMAEGTIDCAGEFMAAELLDSLRPREDSPLSRTRQLYMNLYSNIESGCLPHDMRLPASRELARRLGLGRNTVIRVYEQLRDEGLLLSDGRRGTRVARQVQAPVSVPAEMQGWPVSRRTGSSPPATVGARTLAPGEPDATLFPQDVLRRAQGKALRTAQGHLGYQARAIADIRQSIARFLAAYRSLVIDPEQVVVTAGTRQSLSLAAHLFADPGDRAWVECPGYTGAADAFRQSGLVLTPCELDAQGMVLPQTRQIPRLIYVTPCFQYPTGVALGAERRSALLDLSRRHGSILFEDDYDSEFRDDSQPRPALAAEPAGARVLHAGTFSKLLFPAIRLGWLILPRDRVEQAQHCLKVLGGGSNSLAQALVAELLDNGSIARHLRHARVIYAQRRQRLISSLQGCRLLESVEGVSGSLNLVLHLRQSVSLPILLEHFGHYGIGAQPLEMLDWKCQTPKRCKALVIGLGNVESLAVPEIVAQLVTALESACSST